jgi:hypothetical protein
MNPLMPPSNLVRLERKDYARPAIELAPALLGSIMVRRVDGQLRRARLIEIEAYLGPKDLASHSSKGRTARTEVMFGPPGHAYVYFIYGMHFMFNIVAGVEGEAEALLVRGAEPLDGWDVDLSGPGRLARAFGIVRADNGLRHPPGPRPRLPPAHRAPKAGGRRLRPPLEGPPPTVHRREQSGGEEATVLTSPRNIDPCRPATTLRRAGRVARLLKVSLRAAPIAWRSSRTMRPARRTCSFSAQSVASKATSVRDEHRSDNSLREPGGHGRSLVHSLKSAANDVCLSPERNASSIEKSTLTGVQFSCHGLPTCAYARRQSSAPSSAPSVKSGSSPAGNCTNEPLTVYRPGRGSRCRSSTGLTPPRIASLKAIDLTMRNSRLLG